MHHDNLVVDMVAGNIAEVAVGVDFVADIPFEDGLEDILDYMLVVRWAVHVLVVLIADIVHIDLEVGNRELGHMPVDLELAELHMPEDHLVEDMTFFSI